MIKRSYSTCKCQTNWFVDWFSSGKFQMKHFLLNNDMWRIKKASLTSVVNETTWQQGYSLIHPSGQRSNWRNWIVRTAACCIREGNYWITLGWNKCIVIPWLNNSLDTYWFCMLIIYRAFLRLLVYQICEYNKSTHNTECFSNCFECLMK